MTPFPSTSILLVHQPALLGKSCSVQLKVNPQQLATPKALASVFWLRLHMAFVFMRLLGPRGFTEAHSSHKTSLQPKKNIEIASCLWEKSPEAAGSLPVKRL